jgi:GDPmannose 4,6-dehydratase
VEMQWLMLQQQQAEDFVIATGVQKSVREFVQMSAAELGITLKFEGDGEREIGIVQSVGPVPAKLTTAQGAPTMGLGASPAKAMVKPGDVVVRVDPRYYRPTEVETLLGDPTKAKEKLGWVPRTTLAELCSEMVASDYLSARRDSLVKLAGFQAYDYHE